MRFKKTVSKVAYLELKSEQEMTKMLRLRVFTDLSHLIRVSYESASYTKWAVTACQQLLKIEIEITPLNRVI